MSANTIDNVERKDENSRSRTRKQKLVIFVFNGGGRSELKTTLMQINGRQREANWLISFLSNLGR